MADKPFRVRRAFEVKYRMRGKTALYYLLICLSCGHWREIWNTTPASEIIGRQFSCTKCREATHG